MDSPSHEVSVVASLAARDVRSNLGANLALIRRETGLDPWVVGPCQLKQALESAELADIPETDRWRIPYLNKLLSQKLEAHYNGDLHEEKNLRSLIDSLVVN